MPSPTSALSFAPKAPASATTPGNAAAANDETATKKPAFDDMVRRPAKRDDAPRAADARARETKEPIRQRQDTTARKQEDAARTTSEDDKPNDTVAAAPVTPVLIELPPALPALPVDAAAVVLADPLGNPLLGNAPPTAPVVAADTLLAGSPGATPAALPGALATAMATTVAGIDAGPAIAGDAAQSGAADATSTLPTPATATTEAKAPLQNLLSFAAHLASGQVAAAVPDAINLGRDIVDALRSEDGDAPTPVGNLLAGVGASNSALGLSRTETVNAMEAPSADLHGGHFDDDIGDAVRWMADQKIGHAHIKVTPNDLGTVEIRLRLEGDRVHADFASAQADVRQALESSLPRLRDMLGQHGFQLAHADVGQQHAPPSQDSAAHAGEGTGDAGEPAAEAPRTVRMTARGLVDAYA